MTTISIVLEHGLDGLGPPSWAASQLVETIRDTGETAEVVPEWSPSDTPGATTRVRAGLSSGGLSSMASQEGVEVPRVPESFVLVASRAGEVFVVGSDERGVVYGLLELADRVRCAGGPRDVLRDLVAEVHQPATQVRGILRAFVSEVQDKAWFYSREFWTEYLTELATHRVNRFQLALGMQHNYSHDIDLTDYYLCFAYPYLVNVPGFSVYADGLPAEERQRNLEALRFVSDEAARRSIHFQLGLWNHAYDPGDSPRLRYPVRGLAQDSHAEYCAAALATLLEACPSISGVTLRVHYEGGVPEIGQERFWGKVLSGLAEVRRPIEVDMHAKGVSEGLIKIGLATGSPLLISAKYWAEHQGLPYHQSSIRDMEKALTSEGTGLDAKTHFTRRFTRYGYGDFLREDRPYGVIFRIWPGTQRVLLWGDPLLASGYGRLGTFAGALGVELAEPLTFKGRMGSGGLGERDPYVEKDLQLGVSDWKKFDYTYRLWGRLLYDPGADPSGWRRYLKKEFGAAAPDVEGALAAASRILPLITTAHGIGASNNGFWPEVYVNMPIARGARSEHYARDTEAPGTFGAVSSFDPGLFSSINDYVDELLDGSMSGRYSPVEVADWLDRLSEQAETRLASARSLTPSLGVAVFRRMEIDVEALAALGRFFAAKNRAGTAYVLYERTRDVDCLLDAVNHYEGARRAFLSVVDTTAGVYQPDLRFGNRLSEHGHWSDRLVDIDEDLAALHAEYEEAAEDGLRAGGRCPPAAVPEERVGLDHTPPEPFLQGEQVAIEAFVPCIFKGRVTLKYRHVNQGESYKSIEMLPKDGRVVALIDGLYTESPYALQYFFVLHSADGDAWVRPGLDVGADVRLANQPYYVLRQAGAAGSTADG